MVMEAFLCLKFSSVPFWNQDENAWNEDFLTIQEIPDNSGHLLEFYEKCVMSIG
jgi:hypothetical protein